MKKNIFKNIAAAALSAAILAASTACSRNETEAVTDAPAGESGTSESAAVSDNASARVTIEGTKFMVDGKELWLSGGNTPWHKWNDFSGNMDDAYWEKTFAKLAEDNMNCTRIWINCNGENIIRLKSTGEIKEVKEGHWSDLDKLFAMAEKYGVYVMPTLLSFDHFKEPNTGYDKWRSLITSKEFSDAYAETYVAEFCKRYGDNEYVFSIDLMNEPDWVFENEECGKIGWENLSYFFGKCASVIHENCDALVTVGLGMVKYNSEKYQGNMISDEYLKEITGSDKAYLDYYSPHFYMWERPHFGFPFEMSPVDFGLDGTKPSIIAETSNDDEAECGISLSEKYKIAHDNGWNGVLVWMEPRADEADMWYRYDLTKAATNDMADYIFDKLYPIGKKETPSPEEVSQSSEAAAA